MGTKTVPLSVALTLLLLLPQSAFSQGNSPPQLTGSLEPREVPEDTRVGTVLYTVSATDPEGGRLTYALRGTSKLRINPTTGKVILSSPLDRESEDTVHFMVSVEDEDPNGENNILRIPLYIIVTDANDNPPIFSRNSYKTAVVENTLPGTTILSNILLSDIDKEGQDIDLECQIIRKYPDACDVFELVRESSSPTHFKGHLVLRQQLHFAKASKYRFRLVASDGIHKENVPAEITVEDIQDSPPKFSGSLSGIVSEDIPEGSVIMRVRAVDGDLGTRRKVLYQLIDNPFGFFEIDSESGDLRTQRPLDREAAADSDGVVRVKVQAYEVDGEGEPIGTADSQSVVTMSITIKDVNDEPPTFSRSEYRTSITENIPDGTPLPNLEMTVQDTDVGTNSVFSLRLVDRSGMFSVEPQVASSSTSVSLRLARGPLDFENPDQRRFVLYVVAEETLTTRPLSSTATVVVDVEDANDNAPVFEQESYTASVSETSSPGTVVMTILAKDKDTGEFGTEGIIYSLFGNGAEKFEIYSTSGVVTVAPCESPGQSNCLDFEEKQEYFLSLQARDDHDRGLATIVPIKISLLDSNDNPPRFTKSMYRAVIDESATVFDPPLYVTATDKDQSSVLQYSLIGGDASHLFVINNETGEITVESLFGLDISNYKTNIFELTVQASDGVGSHTAKIEVFVKDANNNAPIFSENSYMATVQETTPVGSVIDQLVATDADTGSNAEITYTIHKGGYDHFAIDPRSGVITVSKELDYDLRDNYTIEVIAVDGGVPRLTATATLSVSVVNNNDKSPFFTPSTQRTQVREDANEGTVIWTLKAEDPDVLPEVGLSFAIESAIAGVDGEGKQLRPESLEHMKSLFEVNSTTGSVRVASQLDRKVVTEVTLGVVVTDTSAEPTQVGRGILVVTVVDVNDFPPMFPAPWSPESPVLTVSIPEEIPVDSTVTSISASDVDSNIARYELGEPSEEFQIDKDTGVVTLKARLDYEVKKEYSFVVVALDTGVPQLSASATVLVQIQNINDEEPRFGEAAYNASVRENPPHGISVVTVAASDGDEGDFGHIFYSLAGQYKDLFRINESGHVSVLNGAPIDRESLESITLSVVATDAAPQDQRKQTSVPLHIKILDENDHSPTFSQRVYTASVVENLLLYPPAPIIQVTAHDRDTGINAKIRYRITEGNERGLFSLDPDTGILYPAMRLDASEVVSPIKLKVLARDKNGTGEYSDQCAVEITVLPQNQHKPVFVTPSRPNATVAIPENGPPKEFLRVLATDRDKGLNGNLSYHFRIGDQNVQETKEFHLDPMTGALSAKRTLDREEQSKYELVLVAKDMGSPISYETLRFLTILVEDMNDNFPMFSKNTAHQTYKFSVVENVPKNTLIGQVQATDLDAGRNAQVFYLMASKNPTTKFRLDRIHGNIYVNEELDREEEESYQFVVKATNDPSYTFAKNYSVDKSDPSVTLVNIRILDVNDNSPSFQKDVIYAGVPHTAEVERYVRLVAAEDGDKAENGTLVYSIKASNLYKPGENESIGSVLPSPFNITQDGKLITSTPMSQYKGRRFVLEIQAKEVAHPYRIAMCIVDVWIWEKEDLIKVVLSRPPAEVVRFQDDLAEALSRVSEGGVAVVDEIRYHVGDDQKVRREWSDMMIHIVNGTSQVVPINMALRQIDNGYPRLRQKAELYNVEKIQAAYSGISNEEIDARVAALIALMIILFMGFILFVVACCSLRLWVMSPASTSREELVKRNFEEDMGHTTTENPLWMEQKLKSYEEQELTMQVISEFDTSGAAASQGANGEEWNHDPHQADAQSNTYATIQKSHGGTLRSIQLRQLEDHPENNDYATLDHLRKARDPLQERASMDAEDTPVTAFPIEPDSNEFHELRTSFASSPFQPLDSMANRPLPDEPTGDFGGEPSTSRNGGYMGPLQLSLNERGEPILVAELI